MILVIRELFNIGSDLPSRKFTFDLQNGPNGYNPSLQQCRWIMFLLGYASASVLMRLYVWVLQKLVAFADQSFFTLINLLLGIHRSRRRLRVSHDAANQNSKLVRPSLFPSMDITCLVYEFLHSEVWATPNHNCSAVLVRLAPWYRRQLGIPLVDSQAGRISNSRV